MTLSPNPIRVYWLHLYAEVANKQLHLNFIERYFRSASERQLRRHEIAAVLWHQFSDKSIATQNMFGYPWYLALLEL